MKYNVGDRVRIKSLDWYNQMLANKDKRAYRTPSSGCELIGFWCGSRIFKNDMIKFCGQVMTIKAIENEYYIMHEDTSGYWYCDEMIEGLVEELLDKEMEEHQRMCDEIMDIQGIEPIEAEMEQIIHCPEGYIFKDENGNVINATKIVLEKLVVPKFKKGDKIKDKNNRVWYVVEVGNKHFDISRIPNPKGEGTGYFVPMEDQDYYELVPDRELPKTFEECVSVLMLEGGNRMSLEQMNTLRKLIDARNAYWTIYGIENGLGKPWEPTMETVYCISRNENVMKCSYRGGKSNVLEFPTEEMRDTFYENFKSEIESCKEFL